MEIGHHTYKPYEDRITNVILRGVCTTFEIDDIRSGIDDLKLDIKIHNIQKYKSEKSFRDKNNLKIWLIQLEVMYLSYSDKNDFYVTTIFPLKDADLTRLFNV